MRKYGMKNIALAVALLVIAMPAAANAVSIDNVPGESEIDVKAKYEAGSAVQNTYKVDLEWESMEFTYTTAGTRTWNPETHEYVTAAGDGQWTNNGNVITVTNHSDLPVTANFIFNSDPGYTLTGTFTNTSLPLASAVGTQVDAAPSGTTALSLSGTLDESMTDFTKVGTITVSIAKAE